jgi:hypothetical protein
MQSLQCTNNKRAFFHARARAIHPFVFVGFFVVGLYIVIVVQSFGQETIQLVICEARQFVRDRYKPTMARLDFVLCFTEQPDDNQSIQQ